MGLKTFTARIMPVLLCAIGLGGLAAVLTAQSGAASVQLGLFGAYVNPDGPGARLDWKTENEFHTLGFYIYRSTDANSHGDRLPTFYSGCGGCAAGKSYQEFDVTAQPGVPYYYWLSEVDLSGQETFYATTANCGCDRPLILPVPATATLTPSPTWTPAPPTNTPQPTDTVPPGQPTSTPAPTQTWTPTPTTTTATTPTATPVLTGTTAAPTATTPPATPTSPPPTVAATQPPKETSAAPASPGPLESTPAGAPTLTAASTAVAAATVAANPDKPTAAAQARISPTARANATAAGPRPTRVAPGGGGGGGLQTQGLVLIGAAALGLAVLGGVAWRMLRPPARPSDPGAPQV